MLAWGSQGEANVLRAGQLDVTDLGKVGWLHTGFYLWHFRDTQWRPLSWNWSLRKLTAKVIFCVSTAFVQYCVKIEAEYCWNFIAFIYQTPVEEFWCLWYCYEGVRKLLQVVCTCKTYCLGLILTSYLKFGVRCLLTTVSCMVWFSAFCFAIKLHVQALTAVSIASSSGWGRGYSQQPSCPD